MSSQEDTPDALATTATQMVAALRKRFADVDAFIANYGDRQESALFAEAKFLLAELDRVAVEARRTALTEAWQAVDRAVRPLGTDYGQSRWNAGYTQARNEAQNAILTLRDRETAAAPEQPYGPGAMCDECGHFAERHDPQGCHFPRGEATACDCAGMLWLGVVAAPVATGTEGTDDMTEPAIAAALHEHDEVGWAYGVIFDDLGNCGCGYTEDRLAIVRQLLRDCPLYEQERWRSYDSPLAEWLLCVVDSAELIEHGSHLQGSWLTEKGKRFLAVLEDESAWRSLTRDYPPAGYCAHCLDSVNQT